MAQKIYDKKKLKDLHSKRSTVISITLTWAWGELTVERFECRSFNFFYHKFLGHLKILFMLNMFVCLWKG